MSNNMFDLLKELGYEPNKEDSQYISVLAHVAGELLAYRKKHRLTQKQLAERLGVTQAMVSKLESGDSNISVKKLAEIAAKLGESLYVTLNLIPQQDDGFENNENWEETMGKNEYFKGLDFSAC
ncbi:helix-turn-helix domain-containing protein [Fervidobacterium sp.]